MSTSKLQCFVGKQLEDRFSKYRIIENGRPSWLISSKGERLELDFLIDKLGIALEIQGRQHFEFTPVFHNTEYDFKEQQRRDKEKLDICQASGIDLIYICNKTDLWLALPHIYDATRPQEQEGWAFDKSHTLSFMIKYETPKEKLKCDRARHKKRLARELRQLADQLIKDGNISGKHRKRLKHLAKILHAPAVLEWFEKNKGPSPQLLPGAHIGTHSTRGRGRKLIVAELGEKDFIVAGGIKIHLVTFSKASDHTTYECDCRGRQKAKDGVCSHIFAVYHKIVM